MRASSRLPTRFPVGAKYVLERRGTTILRYVELPDGRRIILRPRKALTCCAADVSLVPEMGAAAIAPVKRRTKILAGR